MGHWLSKFLPSFLRRRPVRPVRPLRSGRRPVVLRRHCDDGPAGRGHPAVPAHTAGPCQRLFHHSRSFYIKPRRRYPFLQTTRFPLGILPFVNWEDPSKKPLQSPRIVLKFRQSRTVFIPPPARGFPLRSLPLKPVVEAIKLVPSGPTPQPCPKDMEVKAQEELPKVMAKNEEDRVENNRQKDQNSLRSSDLTQTSKTEVVLSSHKGSPGPLDLNTKHPQDSLSGNTQLSPMCSSPEGQASTSSYSPSRDVLPPLMPDSEAAVPSDPAPRCSQLQEKLTQDMLREDHPPSSPGSLTLCKEMDAEKPSRSNTALASACKRKTSTPPLLGEQGEQPPSPQWPFLADNKNLATLKDTEGQSKKNREDKAEVVAAHTATQPAPSFSPPAWAMADNLSLPAQTGQDPAPITARVLTDLNCQTTLDAEDVEMDTTPPCYATQIMTHPDSGIRFQPVYKIQYNM